jgi:hypothetical protein
VGQQERLGAFLGIDGVARPSRNLLVITYAGDSWKYLTVVKPVKKKSLFKVISFMFIS